MTYFTPNWRPRRSLLFVPAANARAMEKARSLSSDGVIFDLEDSVAPEEKAKARSNMAAIALDGADRREVIVRVTAFASQDFIADLDAALACRPDAVLLPKVERAAEIAAVRRRIGANGPALWAMVETPLAILDIRTIAGEGRSQGLCALVVGPNDLARTTGVSMRPGRTAMIPWFMNVVAAARAFDMAAIDGVYNDFRDEAGLEAECRQGAELGFDGKTLIHPAQIAAANAAFSPDIREIEQARAIVEAFAKPENAGRGVIQIDGEMMERLHLDMARRLLEAVELHGL